MKCSKCGTVSDAKFCETCGNPLEQKKVTNADAISNGSWQMVGESYFDGGLLGYLGWCILGTIITIITVGICFPWALCMVYGWKINHTVIGGRRLRFNGSAIGLFGNWIKWVLLCIITLGIYSFWVFIALEKWKVKNTSFAK